MGRKNKNKKTAQDESDQQAKPKVKTLTTDDILDKNDRDQTAFLCFLPEDAIYYGTRSNLSDKKLEFVLHRILADLNHVLYLDFKQFWATLSFNISFRKCIESCLSYFSRSKYNRYVREDPEEETKTKGFNVAEYQKHIYRIVLFIYHRAVHFQDQNLKLSQMFGCKRTIYDLWVFDIPKIFNFMDIYRVSNQDIARIIVRKAFSLNPDYGLDFSDTLQIIQKKVLPDVMKNLKFILDRSQFQQLMNQQQLRRKMKVLHTLLDLYSSLQDVWAIFPPELAVMICGCDGILLSSQNVFYELYYAQKRWYFGFAQAQLKSLMDGILGHLIGFWQNVLRNFKILLYPEYEYRHFSSIANLRTNSTYCFNRILGQFGIVQSLGKKNRDKRNYMLLQRLMDTPEFQQLYDNLTGSTAPQLDVEPSILKQFIMKVQRIKQLKNPVAKQDQQQQEEQQEQVKQKSEAIDQVAPVKLPTKKSLKEEGQIKPKIKPQQPKNTRYFKFEPQRQYNDDYQDNIDYNPRDHEGQSSDTEKSDEDAQPLTKNPNKSLTEQERRNQQGFRGGRGKNNRGGNNSRRGQVRPQRVQIKPQTRPRREETRYQNLNTTGQPETNTQKRDRPQRQQRQQYQDRTQQNDSEGREEGRPNNRNKTNNRNQGKKQESKPQYRQKRN